MKGLSFRTERSEETKCPHQVEIHAGRNLNQELLERIPILHPQLGGFGYLVSRATLLARNDKLNSNQIPASRNLYSGIPFHVKQKGGLFKGRPFYINWFLFLISARDDVLQDLLDDLFLDTSSGIRRCLAPTACGDAYRNLLLASALGLPRSSAPGNLLLGGCG